MSAERRLSELTAALSSATATLDDVARTRVASRLLAQLDAPVIARRPRRWRGPLVAAIGVAAAAAVLALATRGAARDPAGDPRPAAIASEATPEPRVPLAEGATAWAPARGSVRRQLDRSEATVYGPGWIARRDARLVADAPAIVIDHPRTAQPLELAYRGTTIRTFEATFAVSGASTGVVHVEVMRGELEFGCAGTARTVREGGAAACPSGDVVTAAIAPAPIAIDAPAPVPARRVAIAAPLRPEPPPHAPIPDEPAAPAAPDEPAPPDTPAPAPAIAVAPPPSLAALYDRAEDRLQNGDAAGARAALQAILDAHVDAPEVPLALLELARLQLAAGDSARALALLATLAERTDAGPLAAPATYLRCVALTDRDRAAARACFTELRATFPRSVHAIDATARLAILAADDGDCAAAVPLIDAYLARRATGDLAIALRARRGHCAR